MRAMGPTLVEGNNTSQLRANAMGITARIMESPIPQRRNITRNPGSWRFANGLRPSDALCALQMRQVYNCLWRRTFRSQIRSESRLRIVQADTARSAQPNLRIDGEVVCVESNGVSQFNELMSPRARPSSMLSACCGEDLRSLPLIERKHRVHELIQNEIAPISESWEAITDFRLPRLPVH
jgi:hypothetical protein